MTRLVDPQAREVETLIALASFAGRDILELGCGDGRTGRRLSEMARSVLAVDSDPAVIAKAEAAAHDAGRKNCRYLVHDSHDLDLPPESADVALFSRSL